MKWFKHMTSSAHDEKLCRVISELGLEGYGFYWRMLEIIAGRIGHTGRPSCVYSLKCFSRFMGLSYTKTEHFLAVFDEIYRDVPGVMFLYDKVTGDVSIKIQWMIDQCGDGNRPASGDWANMRVFVFRRDNYTCQYCGKRGGKLECDHVIPISRGGSNCAENLTTACFECNRSKGSKTLDEWRLINE